MTSTEFCASHGGTEDCGGAEAVQGGEADKTGVLCAGDESAVGNKTSETTCGGPTRASYWLIQLLSATTTMHLQII